MKKYDWPDLDICRKFEDVSWEHRVESKIPDGYTKEELYGYIVIERWEPDPVTKTVDLTASRSWIDIEAFEKRLPELWGWCDEQIAKMESIVRDLSDKLVECGCSISHVQVPPSWKRWFNYGDILGIKAIKGNDDEVRIFSTDEDGRFAVAYDENLRMKREERRARLMEIKKMKLREMDLK